MKRRLRFLAACLLVPAAVFAIVLLWPEPLPDTADLPPAIAALGTRAAHGDPAAQVELGRRYYEGDGVPYSSMKALGWFQVAARHGDAKAQFELAQIFHQGPLMPARDPAVLPWLNAHLPVGHIPDGWERSHATGMRWFRAAAEHGYAPAQEFLAKIYFKGWRSSQPDLAEGTKWLAKAVESYRREAAQGSVKAEMTLSTLYLECNGAPGAPAEHIKWLKLAAEHGHKDAQSILASDYEDGYHVPKDEALAVVWYRRAAEQRETTAQAAFGRRLAEGRGVPVDYAEARRFLTSAADQGNCKACIGLALLHLHGHGVPKDEIEAWKWWLVSGAGRTVIIDSGEDDAFREMAAFEARLTVEQQAEAQRRADEFTASHPNKESLF